MPGAWHLHCSCRCGQEVRCCQPSLPNGSLCLPFFFSWENYKQKEVDWKIGFCCGCLSQLQNGENRDLTKPLGQTLRWALLPVSAEGFLPLLAACSISTSSPQSSPPVSNYTAKSTPCLFFPSFFLSPFFFFLFFSFPQQENAYWKWLVFVVPFIMDLFSCKTEKNFYSICL